MFKRLLKPLSPRAYQPHPFTHEQVRAKVYALCQQRGPDSIPEENWRDEIGALRREQRRKRVTMPLRQV